jgi:adenine-specific DNA-methyltransferase
MYPRLLLAKTLLSEEGSIFISIDDNEVHHLREIMNEIFGEENFISTIIWQKVYSPKNTAMYFSEDHDYIMVYTRNSEHWRPNLLPRTDEQNARYINPDNDPRGVWKPSDMTARNYYGAGQYEVTSPSGKKFRSGIGRYWRSSYEKFLELDNDNQIWWGTNGSNMPALKRFLSEVKQGIVPQTLWLYSDVGHTQDAKKELIHYVNFTYTENVLNSVKPTKLLRRILTIATNPEEDDIVMDFFSGSASLAHAVLEQNNIDNGNRQFILVQFPEPLPKPENVLKTIADIGKERIRSVIIKNEIRNFGFACYFLQKSFYRDWQPLAEANISQIQMQFNVTETPLVSEWQPRSLTPEILLLQGFPLDSTIRTITAIKENTLQEVSHDFCSHHLFLCLDEKISDTTVQTITIRPEDVFVCLDNALTDEAKLRLSDRCNLKVI